jgi:hypothetical protein
MVRQLFSYKCINKHVQFGVSVIYDIHISTVYMRTRYNVNLVVKVIN